MLLDSSFGHLSPVTVSGRVRSDTPLIGQQSGLQAAIVEQHVTTDFTRASCNTTLLKEDTQEKKAGEEYLVAKKTQKKCGDEHLPIKKEEKDDVGQWTQCSEKISSTKKEVSWNLILGLRRTEYTLPTGTNLPVVGEAVKGDSGRILIKRPRNGGPFHVSRSSVDKIVSNLGSDERY
ncbi:hypothetical protein BAE44_0001446 [Dichanthelium oligosanthes]|uniref:RING-type E3 ubiquitin transferase n=1 Tax=Dichanthelium oligosanthes TaxID=888268 RepID=A0A1E5WJF1_9POAL|nr:hypothetical protein BAE44_0001446 [Dichanthelium oligosanthes]